MYSFGNLESEPPAPVDPNVEYASSISLMADCSKLALEHEASSYRDLNVGATMLAYNATTSEIVMLSSGNMKLHFELGKYCAEMFVLDQLDEYNTYLSTASEITQADLGQLKPVGMVTVSNATKKQIFEITSKRSPTLQMCDPCTDRYSEHELVDDSMPNATLPENLSYLEVNTIGDYKKMRDDSGASALRNVVRLVNRQGWQRDIRDHHTLETGTQAIRDADKTTDGRLSILGSNRQTLWFAPTLQPVA